MTVEDHFFVADDNFIYELQAVLIHRGPSAHGGPQLGRRKALGIHLHLYTQLFGPVGRDPDGVVSICDHIAGAEGGAHHAQRLPDPLLHIGSKVRVCTQLYEPSRHDEIGVGVGVHPSRGRQEVPILQKIRKELLNLSVSVVTGLKLVVPQSSGHPQGVGYGELGGYRRLLLHLQELPELRLGVLDPSLYPKAL